MFDKIADNFGNGFAAAATNEAVVHPDNNHSELGSLMAQIKTWIRFTGFESKRLEERVKMMIPHT